MKIVIPIFLMWLILGSCQNNNTNISAKKTDSLFLNETKENQLKALLAQHPDSIPVLDALINFYQNNKQYPKALALADSAIRKDSIKNFQYWIVKGDIWQAAGQHDSAIKNYQYYLNTFPDDEAILRSLNIAFAQNKDSNCLALSKKIIAEFPTNENKAYNSYCLGIYFAAIKNWLNADENFVKAIQYDHTMSEAFIERAIAFYDQNKIAECRKILDQYQAINPAYPDTYYWIAKCQQNQHQLDSALLNYNKAFSLDKTFANAKMAYDSLMATMK